ncbi:hypothetical protein [Caballeronia hypogeia]|uniref:hypothetical protein n=1 Tax=Caballeronia hypogeia TaxID=1777140 RepID=UPI0012FDA311|nr:hypothetical protein [Caballeronia hypogeia]
MLFVLLNFCPSSVFCQSRFKEHRCCGIYFLTGIHQWDTFFADIGRGWRYAALSIVDAFVVVALLVLDAESRPFSSPAAAPIPP